MNIIERQDGSLYDYRMAVLYAIVLMFGDLLYLNSGYGIIPALTIVSIGIITFIVGCIVFNNHKTKEHLFNWVLVLVANALLVKVAETLIN